MCVLLSTWDQIVSAELGDHLLSGIHRHPRRTLEFGDVFLEHVNAEHACLQAAAKLAVKIPTPADCRSKGTIPNNTPAQPRSFFNNCRQQKYKTLKF